MKLYFAFALLIIGVWKAALAENLNQSLNHLAAEALEKRFSGLVEIHKKSLKQLQDEGQGRLVSAIERELVLVEALLTELRTQLADKNKLFDLHHVHLVEEQLIRHEFRLVEEISVVQLVVANEKRKEEETKKSSDPKKPVEQPHKEATPAELVDKANALIKKGTDALVVASLLEIRAIQSEIHELEALIKVIQAKPSAAELKEDALLLERHEKSLQILIDRANAGKMN